MNAGRIGDPCPIGTCAGTLRRIDGASLVCDAKTPHWVVYIPATSEGEGALSKRLTSGLRNRRSQVRILSGPLGESRLNMRLLGVVPFAKRFLAHSSSPAVSVQSQTDTRRHTAPGYILATSGLHLGRGCLDVVDALATSGGGLLSNAIRPMCGRGKEE